LARKKLQNVVLFRMKELRKTDDSGFRAEPSL
jgi:hypothetical protein